MVFDYQMAEVDTSSDIFRPMASPQIFEPSEFDSNSFNLLQDTNNELDEADIQLVIDQGHCSRSVAINAILENEQDIVNAIMQLTM